MSRACNERIINLVSSLNLEKGDRLPGERELSLRLKTSRNTVRESLISLAEQGQIEIRKRSGCYLISKTPSTLWSGLRADAEATIDSLRAIGPHLAARVASRVQTKQMRRLETITASIGQHVVEQKPAQMGEEYINFFAVLSELAGNPYLVLLMKELVAVRDTMTRALVLDKAKTGAFFELHVNLLHAIQARDVRRSQLLAAHGLDAFASLLVSAAPSPAGGPRHES